MSFLVFFIQEIHVPKTQSHFIFKIIIIINVPHLSIEWIKTNNNFSRLFLFEFFHTFFNCSISVTESDAMSENTVKENEKYTKNKKLNYLYMCFCPVFTIIYLNRKWNRKIYNIFHFFFYYIFNHIKLFSVHFK